MWGAYFSLFHHPLPLSVFQPVVRILLVVFKMVSAGTPGILGPWLSSSETSNTVRQAVLGGYTWLAELQQVPFMCSKSPPTCLEPPTGICFIAYGLPIFRGVDCDCK